MDYLLLLVLCFFVAAMVKVVHHAIGSPNVNEDGSPQFNRHQIFSHYGRWLTLGYIKFLNRDNMMQQVLFSALEQETLEKEKELADHENRKADLTKRPDSFEQSKILTRVNINYFLPLGLCILCFSVWFSLFSFLIILPFFGVSYLWLPFLVAGSTMMTIRL